MLWASLLFLSAFASACTQTVAGRVFDFQGLPSCDFYTPQFQYHFGFCEPPSLTCGGDVNVSVCQTHEGSSVQVSLGTWDATAEWALENDVVSIFRNGAPCGGSPAVVVTHYICQDQPFPKLRNVSELPDCQYNFFVTVPLKVCQATASPTSAVITNAPSSPLPTSSPTPALPTTSTPTTSPTSPTPSLPTTFKPTASPTSPTAVSPTTLSPSLAPTTFFPTVSPTLPTPVAPTHSPTSPTTMAPTLSPTTLFPTTSTLSPAAPSTLAPSMAPSTASPVSPTTAPTSETNSPSTTAPTSTSPTTSPTKAPSLVPSASPTTSAPSKSPSTLGPTTSVPTTLSPASSSPTTSAPTTGIPTTLSPTSAPTTPFPTSSPTRSPTNNPTTSPTTLIPTLSPTTSEPTTSRPTMQPTNAPTSAPTYSCSPTPEVFYPRRGYWSQNETSQPSKCAVFLACPGSCGETAEYPVQINADGSRVVSQCASQEGYQGELCTSCSGEYYRGFGGACEVCGSETEKLLHLIGVFVVSGVLFLGFGLSIIVLTERNLHWIGQIIVWFQMFVMLGALVASRLEKAWLVSIFDFLIVFNFGLESLQPGCQLFEHTNSLGYFWATILFNLTAVVLCILCSFLYGYRVSPQRLTQRGYTQQRAVLRRFGYALGLLLCIQYYQLAFRSASMLNCVSHDGSPLALATDPNIECYKGDHLVAAIVSWFIVFVLVSFPAWGFVSLWRGRARSYEDTPSMLLFLVRGLKRQFAWLTLFEIFVNSLLIAQWAFTRSASLLMLLAFICFSLYVSIAGAAWVFLNLCDNVLFISTRSITMVVLLVGAGLFESHDDFIIDSSPVFLTGAILCAVCIIVLLVAQLAKVCARQDRDAFSQLAADESDVDALVSHVNVQFLAIDPNDEF